MIDALDSESLLGVQVVFGHSAATRKEHFSAPRE
jgi:hypothetical protein